MPNSKQTPKTNIGDKAIDQNAVGQSKAQTASTVVSDITQSISLAELLELIWLVAAGLEPAERLFEAAISNDQTVCGYAHAADTIISDDDHSGLIQGDNVLHTDFDDILPPVAAHLHRLSTQRRIHTERVVEADRNILSHINTGEWIEDARLLTEEQIAWLKTKKVDLRTIQADPLDALKAYAQSLQHEEDGNNAEHKMNDQGEIDSIAVGNKDNVRDDIGASATPFLTIELANREAGKGADGHDADSQNAGEQSLTSLVARQQFCSNLDRLPPLLANPEQALAARLLSAGFENRTPILQNLLNGATVVLIEVPSGMDVKTIETVLPKLLFGPSPQVAQLNAYTMNRLRSDCYVVDGAACDYNLERHASLLKRNILHASEMAVPVIILKSRDLFVADILMDISQDRFDLPELTGEMILDTIKRYANAKPIDGEIARSETKVKSEPSIAKGEQYPNAVAQLLAASTRDIAKLGSFVIASAIYRGCNIDETCARIVALLDRAKVERELFGDDSEDDSDQDDDTDDNDENADEKAAAIGFGGNFEAGNVAHNGLVAQNNKKSNQQSGSAKGKSAGSNDDGPRLEDLSGYGPAAEWGFDLARDLEDYRAGHITWSEVDRGLVLAGPPGIGKTIFAKALAKTCNVNFIATSFANWESKKSGHLGDMLKAMADQFEEARKQAPCIMLIDEIDTLPDRNNVEQQAKSWWTSIVNAVLEQLDGSMAREGVIVIGACNNADNLDPALVRSGRLEKIIHIPYPSAEDLAKIFRFHLKDDLPECDLLAISEQLAGFTGADVEAAVRSARREARRPPRGVVNGDSNLDANQNASGDKSQDKIQQRRDLTEHDLDQALYDGPQLSEQRQWRIAVHEAGHAIAAIALDIGTVDFISVRSRGMQGGFVRLKPNENHADVTRDILLASVAQALSGRAAEIIMLGQADAGSGGPKHSDLAKATQWLRDFSERSGLGRDKKLYWHAPYDGANSNTRHADQRAIEADLQEQQKRAKAIIELNRALVEELATTLRIAKTMNAETFANNFQSRVVMNDKGEQHGIQMQN